MSHAPTTKAVMLDASPTKRFFVDMLTRDIELHDAVLDLLDNCVDGVLRSGFNSNSEHPYEGYWAKLTFSDDGFMIEDNCGGISKKLAEESAFRIGRPKSADKMDADLPTVGMYGIGMKRAIFKIGRHCEVTSRTKKESWKVTIPESWFKDEHDWELTLKPLAHNGDLPGTKIRITKLDSGVATSFASPSGFSKTFRSAVSQHYSLIIEKGFEVIIDNNPVKPLPLLFRTVDLNNYTTGIAPFMFEGRVDGVDIDLHVGFYNPTPDEDDDNDDDRGGTTSADEAGWTIICNDRVVVHRDKTRLTGWGEAGVPNFHNQFIGIAGVVHFRSNDALRLPLTTTKRGIDAGSDVFLQIKDKMRDGLKKFTSYTNRLKKDSNKKRELFDRTAGVDLKTIREKRVGLSWSTDRKLTGRTFVPDLPPVASGDLKTIRFLRSGDEIRKVSNFLFGDPDIKSSDVGAECFDKMLNEAKKR